MHSFRHGSTRLLASAVLAIVLLASCGGPEESGPPPSPDTLKGRWERPDGGYVLQFGESDSSGKIQAAYFNPQPIHVSKSEVSQTGTELRVFVELNDRGYPGSTYTLRYDPKQDILQGTYYQAGLGERFEVFFVRLKPDRD